MTPDQHLRLRCLELAIADVSAGKTLNDIAEGYYRFVTGGGDPEPASGACVQGKTHA